MRSRHLLADQLNRERLAHFESQRPARRFLALRRATRRAQRRIRHTIRRARHTGAELEP